MEGKVIACGPRLPEKPLPEFSSGHISLSPIKDKIKGENESDPASPSTLVVSTFWLCLSVYYIVLRCQAVFEEFFS